MALAFAGALLLLFGVPRAAGRAEGRQLQVATAEGRLVLALPVRDGERFDVAFTHSAERCRWIQHYRAGARGIEQVGSTFAAFGAGMPSEPTDGSAVSRGPEGFTVAAPVRLGEVPMLFSRAADLRIRHRDAEVAIDGGLQEFDRFTVRIR